MKTILFSVLTIAIIVLIYFLYFYSGRIDSIQTAESKTKGNSYQAKIDDLDKFTNKLSMKQIDSISALSNYNFTQQNISRDIVSAQSADQKSKKL